MLCFRFILKMMKQELPINYRVAVISFMSFVKRFGAFGVIWTLDILWPSLGM